METAQHGRLLAPVRKKECFWRLIFRISYALVVKFWLVLLPLLHFLREINRTFAISLG